VADSVLFDRFFFCFCQPTIISGTTDGRHLQMTADARREI